MIVDFISNCSGLVGVFLVVVGDIGVDTTFNQLMGIQLSFAIIFEQLGVDIPVDL